MRFSNEKIQPQVALNIPVGRLAQRPSMVGGRPVGGGDVGARQQEPAEIDTGAPISEDDCSGLARRRCGDRGSGHPRLQPVDLDNFRLRNPWQAYHWLVLV